MPGVSDHIQGYAEGPVDREAVVQRCEVFRMERGQRVVNGTRAGQHAEPAFFGLVHAQQGHGARAATSSNGNSSKSAGSR